VIDFAGDLARIIQSTRDYYGPRWNVDVLGTHLVRLEPEERSFFVVTYAARYGTDGERRHYVASYVVHRTDDDEVEWYVQFRQEAN